MRRRLTLAFTFALITSAIAIPVPVHAGSFAAIHRAPTDPIVLSVGTFNIEYGGTVIDFDRIVEAAKASGADVLGIEEAWGHVPRLAKAAGYPYHSVRTGVISRYPLIDPPGSHGRYVFVELRPGRVVAVQNVHLPSSPYGPNRIVRGATREEILQAERDVRLAALRPFLAAAKRLLDDQIPVFLVGDFNAPSHRDWTRATVGLRSQILYPVRWPVSIAVERAGFRDSYRAEHPNPVAHPGLTWWAARPRSATSWNPGANAPQDRIDMVYAAGAQTLRSRIVGEPSSSDVDVAVWPWGTDHRAVVSRFSVRPAIPSDLVAVQRRLVVSGATLGVTYRSPDDGGEHVAVAPQGGDPVADAVASVAVSAAHGNLDIDTTGWAPAAYDVVLLDGANTPLSATRVWIAADGATPAIGTGSPSYVVGEPLDITWSNVRGDRWDWIGIYRRGADPTVAWYLLWVYTEARVAGSVTMGPSSVGPWPLEEGRYSVYLLRDDGYRVLARADFEIVAS